MLMGSIIVILESQYYSYVIYNVYQMYIISTYDIILEMKLSVQIKFLEFSFFIRQNK